MLPGSHLRKEIACLGVCSLLRGGEGKTLTKPIPQICQQKQQRGTVLAELQEGGCMQAQACMESGVLAAVRLLSKLS